MSKRGTIQVIVTSLICLICISLRTGYRLLYKCKFHVSCHRRWHIDDLWMAFSFLPLLGRAVCIAWSSSAAEVAATMPLSKMLLLPARIFYALFLWCMKMCLLELYLRICKHMPLYRCIGLCIRWSLYLTFVAVVLATLLECRPLKLAWNDDPAGKTCRKGRANLIAMGACNILTDLALIIFPISFLRQAGLDISRFRRLGILFALGSLIIITTIVRLPLILRDDAQVTRSLWASIEIACAAVVANAPFFQAVIIDAQLGGMHNPLLTSSERRPSQSSTSQRRLLGSRTNSYRTEVTLWHIEDGSADLDGIDRVGSAWSGDAFITVPKGCCYEEVGESQKGLLLERRVK